MATQTHTTFFVIVSRPADKHRCMPFNFIRTVTVRLPICCRQVEAETLGDSSSVRATLPLDLRYARSYLGNTGILLNPATELEDGPQMVEGPEVPMDE